MIRQLTNVTNDTIELADFHGLQVAAGQQFDGLQFGTDQLRDSTSILDQVLHKNLTVYDGFSSYTGIEGVDFIRGTATQISRDGKPIVTASDRPKNTLWYLTSKADDLVNGVIGGGTKLDFTVNPGDTQTKDMQFLTDIWIKQGSARYGGSDSDASYLSVHIVCPAGVPFPSFQGIGNYDNVNGSWIPNATGTGAYFILPTATVVHRFINELPLTAYTHEVHIQAPECDLLPASYILRIIVHNGGDASTDLHAAVNISCYRSATVTPGSIAG